MYVTELNAGNCTILHPDNTVVAQVRTSRVAVEETEDEDEDEDGEEGASEGSAEETAQE